MIAPQRLRLPITIAGIFLLTFFIGVFTTSSGSPAANFILSPFKGAANPHFHLLLPATASNVNFCKLLLSAAVTGYPNPILLGWEGHGRYNGTESHLFKISETLAYLERLPPSTDEDLILILDAYDIWLQLPPDVLIQRYHVAIEKANARLRSEGIYTVEHGGAHIKQSILFGPDKTCWPDDERRAACWAVPESSLPSDAFGPATDTWVVPNRPRWLNSGTIMGPAKDMRAMFSATMDVLRRKFDEDYEFRNSDQFYFQEMWTEQEIGRLELKNGTVEAPKIRDDVYGIVPEIPEDQRTEFHVTLDYESDVFQTTAYYTEYLTWMSFNHSTPSHDRGSGNVKRIDQIVLTEDISHSRPPFGIAKMDDSIPAGKGWEDVMLGTNVITQQAFPLLHVTNEKRYRESWWPNMWFHPHAKALLEASKRSAAKLNSDTGIVAHARGVSYVGGKGSMDQKSQGKGLGVWTDRNAYLSWDEVCSKHHEYLFE
jgi:hypothetical protein